MTADLRPWQQTLLHVVFAAWFGGFTFYAAFVIPIGAMVLGGHTEIGFVTQVVTIGLNLLGLVLLAGLYYHHRRQAAASRRSLWRCWWAMVVLQLLLFALHPWVGSYLDAENKAVLEPDAFYEVHRVYLFVAMALWATSLWKLHLLLRRPPVG